MVVIDKFDKNFFKALQTDCIKNRFDLYDTNDVGVVYFHGEKNEDNILYRKCGKEIFLGMYLMYVPKEYIEEASCILFKKYSDVKKVKYVCGYTKVGCWEKHNHYKVSLPETYLELENRLSKKNRYNINREKRIVEKNFGAYNVFEYVWPDIPKQIIEQYFHMKKLTHNKDYGMTTEEYLNCYCVSNVYVLKLEEKIAAILLSCEQCENVYLENLSYDLKYSQYSPGKILYDEFLKIMIKKCKKAVFLAGGDLMYKKHYGSIEENVYDCVIYRSGLRTCYEKIVKKSKEFVHRLI